MKFLLILIGTVAMSSTVFGSTFECSTDNKFGSWSAGECQTETEYCLITQAHNGGVATIECKALPENNCRTSECLQNDAKKAFEYVENCNWMISTQVDNHSARVTCTYNPSAIWGPLGL